jgi:Tol biopolymer transport system component
MKSALILAAAASAALPAVVSPGVISTARNEYNYTRTADGRTAVFARSEAEFRGAKIMVVEGGTSPELIGFSDPRYDDTDPQISSDGRELVFVSNRPLPGEPDRRDLNIWRSHKVDGRWRAPEPVAHANSKGYELGPEVHAGVLTFNSTRTGGPGRLDIWRSESKAEPTPLPAPINTAANEGDFTLSRDGRVALFWSDRPGGSGGGDIWMAVRDGEGWREPVNLGPQVNSDGFDFTPSFSADGRTLYFASTRKPNGEDRMADVYAVPVARVPALAAALKR